MSSLAQISRTAMRGLRVFDIPAVAAQLQFAALRRAYYNQFWIEAAAPAGARCESWEFGYHRLHRDGMIAIVRYSELGLDSHLTLDLMGNKLLTFRLLAEQGFAVPRHVRFSLGNLKPALTLMAETGRPIVVKPGSGTGGGNGVTTGITSRHELVGAAWLASRYDTQLLAEEQVQGHSYRLLYLDGILLDAIRRDPPRIVGDGKSTIRALVKAENRRRLRERPFTALSPLRIDRDARNYLAAQGLSPLNMPAEGETVVLKRAVNQNSSAENHAVTSRVHPATVAAGARLVSNLGVRLAGIDILARDISLPLSPENGLIGEINTTPGLHHHDLVATNNDRQSIAVAILEHLFETGAGVMRDAAKLHSSKLLRKVAG